MGFIWGQGMKKGIIMHVHERPDVVAYRRYFLEEIQRAERDEEVLVFGDGANVFIKEGETFCWHLESEVLYPVHAADGENLGVHSWATRDGLLKGATDLWDVKVEGANRHERFLQQCREALKSFEEAYPGRVGLFIYDNASYAKKKEFSITKKKKQELQQWAEENGINSSGTVKELKGWIKGSEKYQQRVSIVQQLFSSAGHRLLYLPSCHPEYNIMELIWAKVKRHCIEHSDYTREGAWRNIQQGLRLLTSEDSEKMFLHCKGKMTLHWELLKERKWGSRRTKRRRVEESKAIADTEH
jgi:hypothetical protein